MKFLSTSQKSLLVALSFAILAYVSPWINPANAVTEESTTPSPGISQSNCSEISRVTKGNQISLATIERLLGYLESSVSEIKMTVNGIDRKLNTADRQAQAKKTL